MTHESSCLAVVVPVVDEGDGGEDGDDGDEDPRHHEAVSPQGLPRVQANVRAASPTMRPHSQRFCDVAVTVKFYCKCDVAKSFRMGPLITMDTWLLGYL